MNSLCPVCRRDAGVTHSTEGDRWSVQCDRCGLFEIGGSYEVTRRGADPLSDLSGVLRHALEGNQERPVLSEREAKKLMAQAPNTAAAKVERLLEIIALKAGHRAGKPVLLTHARDYSLAYAVDEQEFLSYLKYLANKGWIEVTYNELTATCMMTVFGLLRVEQKPTAETADD